MLNAAANEDKSGRKYRRRRLLAVAVMIFLCSLGAASISQKAWAQQDLSTLVTKLTEDPDPEVRAQAAETLGRMGDEAALPHLIQALKDEQQFVRRAAAFAISAIGPQSIPHLDKAFDDEDWRIRAGVAFTLGGLGPEALTDFSTLVRALKDEDWRVRDIAARALGNIGPAAKETVPALAESLRDGDWRVRVSSAEVLGRMGPDARAAVPALTESLQDENERLRATAAVALGDIGAPAQMAIPRLISGLKDKSWMVRDGSAYALGRIGPNAVSAVDELAIILDDEHPRVRSAAAFALGGIGPAAKTAVPQLATALKDQDWHVRAAAAESLGRLGPEASATVADLVEALQDSEDQVRYFAALALGAIGTTASAGVPALAMTLKDEEWQIRAAAAEALGKIGPMATAAVADLVQALRDKDGRVREPVAQALTFVAMTSSRDAVSESVALVPDLLQALKDHDENVRRAAAVVLGAIGPEAKVAVPHLLEALKDGNWRVRSAAVIGLGGIGPDAKDAIPQLLESLKDSNAPVRGVAARALAEIGPEAEATVPRLIVALQDSDPVVRGSAAEALGTLGVAASVAIPDLLPVLEDSDQRVVTATAVGLAGIAAAIRDAEATASIGQLEQVRDALALLPGTNARDQLDTVERAIEQLSKLRQSERSDWRRRILHFAQEHPGISLAVTGYVALLSVLLLVFWRRPLWLLRINDALAWRTDLKLPDWAGGITVPLRYAVLVGFFHHRTRVLDAWVADKIAVARQDFAHKRTVENRKVHIDVPVTFNREPVAAFSVAHLRPLFERNLICLLIWGEGGSGKTSIACQIAKWAMAEDPAQRLSRHLMIPILIENELDLEVQKQGQPFTEAVRRQLQVLLDETEPISEKLLEFLLRRKRILVVVDHFSEMSDDTRSLITPGSAGFYANALIITSRREETLGQMTRSVIQPMRIAGNRLSEFLGAYLVQQGKRDLFDDTQFFEGCSRLSRMVGNRHVTPLFARLYADQLIATREEDAATDTDKLAGAFPNLPESVPDLMLSYLKWLNRKRAEDGPDNRQVQQDAKLIAWHCLQETFRPSDARRDALTAELEGEDADARLRYLEQDLRLIQTVGAGEEHIRFELDPLAEFLAALHLMEAYGADSACWSAFLSSADAKPGKPESIKEFLQAVLDCYVSRIEAADQDERFVEGLRRRIAVSEPPDEPIAEPPAKRPISGLAPEFGMPR